MRPPAASFRDPAGRCCFVDQRVLRVVAADSAAQCEAFLKTPCARDFTSRRQLVSTQRLDADKMAALQKLPGMEALSLAGSQEVVFEHERIPFPSYPYEWPPEMLWEAGRLTLEFASAALADGYGLKDATPYNVLYRGSEPVFIDVLSFEPRVAGDPLWRPYGQFVRNFLLPLLVNKQWSMRLTDIFTTHRDGLEPEDVYNLCGPLQRFKPQVLSLVSIPTWLSGKARTEGDRLYRSHILANAEKATFILESLLKQLQRTLDRLKPRARKVSLWSKYMAGHSYSPSAFAAKEKFVDGLVREFRPARVLDIGANIGHFSECAAKAGAEVVALDLDPVCVGALWKQAREKKLPILPLVVDLGRPSPALGWRNAECESFLDRATGAFDCVLMLAVLHHLLVTERIPLEEILHLMAQLTMSLLVIEFIPPEDEMFRELTRGREHLHTGLSQQVFEAACAPHFQILSSVPLPQSHRRMYCLKLKGGGS